MVRRMRIAEAGLATAGLIHVGIAVRQFEYASAHGLFFCLLGLAQVFWASIAWSLPETRLQPLGLGLAGGPIVLWTLVQTVAVPLASHPETIEWTALASKGAEAIAFVALLAGGRRRGKSLGEAG